MVQRIAILVLFFSTFQYFDLNSQDISASQFNAVALYYNPSSTGSFPGNYRISSLYRNQWIGFQDEPITQFIISGDIKFYLGYESPTKDFIGAGVYFGTDRAQLFDWNTNEMGIQLAYHKIIDKNKLSFISGGIGFGLQQRSVNYDRLFFEDQYNGLDAYNGSTNEILPQNIHATPNLVFGLEYSSYVNKRLFWQMGLSAKHLFSNEFSFYNNLENPDYVGSRENQAFSSIIWMSHLVYRYDAFNEISPRMLLQWQGPHGMLLPGFSYRRAMLKNNQTAVHMGVSSRIVKNYDAFSISDLGLQLGLELQTFMVGLQYEFGLRDATKYGAPTHSFEISLRLMGAYENQFQFAPRF